MYCYISLYFFALRFPGILIPFSIHRPLLSCLLLFSIFIFLYFDLTTGTKAEKKPTSFVPCLLSTQYGRRVKDELSRFWMPGERKNRVDCASHVCVNGGLSDDSFGSCVFIYFHILFVYIYP